MSKTFSTERICAFTDGVYAIVITLLVLELKAPEVPGLTNEQVLADLAKQSRVFLAYFISFFVVGWLWFRHHGIFKALEKSDNVVILINFIHLLFVSLIPYTASVAGRYAQDQLAVLMFFGNIGLSGLTVSLLKQYVLPKSEWQNHGAILLNCSVKTGCTDIPFRLLQLWRFSSLSTNHQVALWFFLILTPLIALTTWR